jgi:hypothetical protein
MEVEVYTSWRQQLDLKLDQKEELILLRSRNWGETKDVGSWMKFIGTNLLKIHHSSIGRAVKELDNHGP